MTLVLQMLMLVLLYIAGLVEHVSSQLLLLLRIAVLPPEASAPCCFFVTVFLCVFFFP